MSKTIAIEDAPAGINSTKEGNESIGCYKYIFIRLLYEADAIAHLFRC